ncbi:hypothetical protein [Mesorhizobium sp. M0058]|uniref:hypothetical protein n=1 Tax=Mesorhizobium sp. M0058 TaxID=2956865 RepID=UPI00333D0BFB
MGVVVGKGIGSNARAVGWQDVVNPRLSRRSLLGGMASSPMLFYAGTSQANGLSWYDLQFRISDDLSTLNVIETKVDPSEKAQQDPASEAKYPETRTPVCSWTIPALAFGPAAFFDMVQPASQDIGPASPAPQRIVYVRNVQYGLRYGDKASTGTGKGGFVAFKFQRPALRWIISYITDLWLLTSGGLDPIISSRPAEFQVFRNAVTTPADNTRPLPFEDIADSRVDRTLDAMFGGLIHSEGSGGEDFRVTIDANLIWTVTATGQRRLSAFEGRARLSRFSFAWRRADPLPSADSPEAADPPTIVYFSGQAGPEAIQLTHPEALVEIGDASGHHLRLKPAEACELHLDTIVGPATLMPGRLQVVSALTLGKSVLAIAQGNQALTDGVASRGVVLAETVTPRLRKLSPVHRTVLWGESSGVGPRIAGTVPHKGKWPVRGEIPSPVGLLRVDEPVLRTDSKIPGDSAAAKPAAGDDAPPAGTDTTSETTNAIAITVTEPSIVCEPTDKDSNGRNSSELARFFQIANGDRGGAPDATLYMLHDRPLEGTGPAGIRRIQIDLSLFATNAALPDTSYSRLAFRQSDVRLNYEDGKLVAELPHGEYPLPIASSFVWVGPLADGVRRASLDLGGATLTCGRDYDLMKLRLRFRDLHLEYYPGPRLVPALDDARVWIGDDGAVHDSRPILVAEFDPQHVMEEAIFRPEAPPLPDVELEGEHEVDLEGEKVKISDRNSVLAQLEEAKTSSKRALLRQKISELKVEQEARKEVPNRPFATLAKAFAAVAAGLPADQRVYIGPFALDPDAMAVARKQMEAVGPDAVRGEVTAMIDRIDDLVVGLKDRLQPIKDASSPPPEISEAEQDAYFANALRNESLFESSEPFYSVFRNFWRDTMVQLVALLKRKATPEQIRQRLGFDVPASFNLVSGRLVIEFLAPANRSEGYAKDNQAMPALTTAIVNRFVDAALGRDIVKNLLSARLSGKSRLAFRIDCEAAVGADAREAGTYPSSGDGPSAPGSGSTAFRPLPFTFEALTDWSRLEPAVTRRARKLYEALPSGVLPPLGKRGTNSSDQAMMRFQGFAESPMTGEARMAKVRALLDSERTADPVDGGGQPFPGEPLDFETAIEIPSRLILSTAQDAIWRTNRRMPPVVYSASADLPGVAFQEAALEPGLEEGEGLAGPKADSAQPRDLWSVRLETTDAEPGLRAVASPDLRLAALGGYRSGDALRLPGHGAPPRGPYAPWFIGREQMESNTLTAEAVAGELKQNEPDKVCVPASEPNRFRLIRWLCERAGFRDALPMDDYTIFRTSLDAFDRHQLVLQSSSYGLPVIGKRHVAKDADPNDVTSVGGLIADSGQIEPGEAFALLDATDDQALYKPVPLNLKALTLSALGGSFLHETSFKPSAGADDIFGHKIFEGFSIDTLQQDIVLGRDIRTEVVYKGYLLPLGHKASFVKLTERIFLRTPEQGIKAMLRQRMFLRMTEPDKIYGALGQPFAGRMWCGKLARLLADKTPDILDPNSPMAGAVDPENLNGRISLSAGPGLAFWPRTDITENGVYRFDVSIDGSPTAMPMIFVDNIAATTPESLKAAVDHYNAALKPEKAGLIDVLNRRRTISLGGRKIDYAPNSRAGEAQFETDTIRVRAQGRSLSTPAASWTGKLDDKENFATTGVLEGAGQPPFYPAMEQAVIRLGSVERMSGGEAGTAKVEYDGHYVLYGFPGETVPRDALGLDEKNANPQEVFLNICDDYLPMKMGGNGDRSGGIARPESHIIAISRSKGPLGGDASAWWSGGPTQQKPAASDTFQEKKAGGQPDFGKRKFATGELSSLAYYFNNKIARPTVAPAPLQPGEPSSEPPPVNMPPDPAPDQLEIIKQVQSFFSLDAKLLGTIKLKDLMWFLGLSMDSVPVLKEVQEFGTAALRGAEDQLGSLSNDVRTRVLAPLQAVVVRLSAEWRKLDAMLQQKQRELQARLTDKNLTPLSLSTIYPEVDGGLTALSQALADAIATEDAIALVPKLAAIHTAARRLVRGIAAITANPVERLEQAVVGNVQEQISDLTDGGLRNLADIAKALETFKDALKEDAPKAAAKAATDWIFDRLQSGPVESAEPSFRLPLAALTPDLADLLKKLVPTVETDAAQLWNAVAGTGGIAPRFLDAVRAATRDALKSTIEATIVEVVSGGNAEAALKAGVDTYIGAVRVGIDDAQKEAKAALDQFVASAAKSTERQAALALQDAIDRLLPQATEWSVGVVDEIQPLIAGLEHARAAVDSGKNLAKAVRVGDPKAILAASGAFAQDVFGIDVGDLQAQLKQKVTEKLLGSLKSTADAVFDAAPLALGSTKLPILLREVEACAPLKLKPRQHADLPVRDTANQVEASNNLLLAIGKAIDVLQQAEAMLPEVEKVAEDPAVVQSGLQAKLLTYKDNLKTLIAGAESDLGLVSELSDLYGNIVDLQVSLRTLADAANPADLDEAAVERIGAVARSLRWLGEQISNHVQSILNRVASFTQENAPFVVGGLVVGGFADFLTTNGVTLAQLKDANRATLEDFKAKAAQWETVFVQTAEDVVNLGCRLVTISTAGPVDAIAGLQVGVQDLAGIATSFGFPLDPESTQLIAALDGVKRQLTAAAGVKLEPIGLKTIKNLLGAELSNKKPLKAYFQGLDDPASYFVAARALRNAEAAVLRHWRALQLRLKGAPPAITNAIEDRIASWQLFDTLTIGYLAILGLRKDLLGSIGNIQLFAPFARRALLVEAAPALAATGALACDIGDVTRPVTDLATCDRLAQEKAIVEAAKGFAALTGDERAALRRRIVALFQGWYASRAAPLVIIAQAGEMAKDLLRGDILAAIDFGAFRDQIEDAIAALIPTKVKFSYDFNSKVTTPTGDTAIFQPKVGSAFGITVRASLDLLNQKAEFAASASMGPFDIYLIGGVADALRLKFGGAAFSISDGSKARFDVKYEDFTIGKDLEFAQSLQSFLTPKEGNGVFIQPMTRGAGIEAGYGINLGTIGVGFTSFFNVSLNVSAELPFGDEEALFKVSLGRRLSPFSMGVLPFVGSGYFSIYAASDGVRGFEASFEYGGGAAIGYGPMQAQCRISVGVFVRILKANGRRTTEIYGTFFAGGSASIWIFHFATSLYVRLGTAQGGEMYGEATYSFSFSLGIADYDYSITALRQEGKLGSGPPSGAGQIDDQNGTRFAMIRAADAPQGIDPMTTGATDPEPGHIIIDAADQTINWGVYATYFETGLLEGMKL